MNTFRAMNPSTGEPIEPSFYTAGERDVDKACALAAEAFPFFSGMPLQSRANFLEMIAQNILAIGDDLIVRAMAETGLPRARLEGERDRTARQLFLMAKVTGAGDWLDATIDPPISDRKPLPRPDLRRLNVGLGPVAVFGASNFPLAFSVAGGDTASALAAGCPVVFKGHPAHPGTSELVGQAIRKAVTACDLPEGVFSLLMGDGHDLGSALVGNPLVKAVGFTGSRAGGLALTKIAASRPEPIPVYAEMSSINPTIILPAALAARAKSLAQLFVQSLTMGAGQFCTNPGVILAIEDDNLEEFADAARLAVSNSMPACMLTPGIYENFEQGVSNFEKHPAVSIVARGSSSNGPNQARAALFKVHAAQFLADPMLWHEVFGPSSLIVACTGFSEMAEVINRMEGQLTATLHFDPVDEPLAARLIPLLASKAGRILANGWPTGVEVSHAIVHGGPYPATTDSRTTSVGSLAIARFVRPICYQDIPDGLLPAPLRHDNPFNISRRIDGIWSPASTALNSQRSATEKY